MRTLALRAPALALDRMVTLINRSGYTLVEFYAAPVTAGDREEDSVGADMPEPGYCVDLLIADGGTHCHDGFLMVLPMVMRLRIR